MSFVLVKSTMHLAAYVRRSREDDGYGLASQETEIRQWAATHNHEVSAVCVDNGVGGNVPAADRPGLAEALSLLGTDELDGLIVHSQDRLARALHIQEAVFAEVWRHGKRIFTTLDGEIAQDDPDDPMRTFVRQVMGAVNELQRRQVIANMRRGRREKARQGGYVGGFTNKFGYELVKGEWAAVQEEQTAIRLAHRLRREGRTLREIGEALSASGSRPKGGGAWHPNSVRRLLD
jgi:DNA invertase Pin-like site-specific DNA recombinase